jgi:tetratricopeptide (TPR) repeat protein
MHHYGVRDVEKLLGLPRSTIRALVEAGFVTPARGPRNAWQFSFQDLIVLRTAQSLAAAKLSHRRITKSLKELRRHLPPELPLSGLRIGAVADRVVVKDGGQQWSADSGQYLLAFEGDPVEGSLSVFARSPQKRGGTAASAVGPGSEGNDEPRAGDAGAIVPEVALFDPANRATDPSLPRGSRARAKKAESPRTRTPSIPSAAEVAAEWFERAVDLERDDVDAAVHAYERAIAADPTHLEAHVNFGRLLHEAGRLAQAERAYRAAIGSCGDQAIVHFNLGVLLEDTARDVDAVEAYEAAVSADPTLADAHYNLALLYERLAKPKEAIRHMAQYRRLVANR